MGQQNSCNTLIGVHSTMMHPSLGLATIVCGVQVPMHICGCVHVCMHVKFQFRRGVRLPCDMCLPPPPAYSAMLNACESLMIIIATCKFSYDVYVLSTILSFPNILFYLLSL